MSSLLGGARGLLFSLIVIYVLGIALVVFAPHKLSSEQEVVLPDGNITHADKYTKDGRYESVVVANSSIATIIVVMITARLFSWTGDHLVTLMRDVSGSTRHDAGRQGASNRVENTRLWDGSDRP